MPEHIGDSENKTATANKENTSPSDVKYITLGNTTYEVVSNYVGKVPILDIVKSAIRRDIESGNY